MAEPPSDASPLLQAGVRGRPSWISVLLFLIFEILITTPGEIPMVTLGIQYARSAFARQRNFSLPEGVNACGITNASQTLIDIQAETALFTTYQSFLVDFLPVFTGLPLIAVSEYTGRRPILLLKCLGPLGFSLGFLVVSYFELSVYYTLIGAAVFGGSGGFVLINVMSTLYVTDIVSAEHRGVAIATIYGLQIFVLSLAPLILNSVLDALSSFPAAYLITTCLALLPLLWMLPPGIIRESVEKQPLDLGQLTGSITRAIWDVFAGATGGRRWRLVLILACFTVVSLALYGTQNSVTLFALGERFCWSPTQIGIFSVLYGVPNGIVTPFAVWILERLLSDYWAIYLSILSGAAMYVIIGTATTNEVLLYIAPMASLFYGMSLPVNLTLLTRLVDKKSHGALFSFYVLVFALAYAASMIGQSFAYSLAVRSGHAQDLFFVLSALVGSIFIPTVVLHILEPKGGFQSNANHNVEPNGLDNSDFKNR